MTIYQTLDEKIGKKILILTNSQDEHTHLIVPRIEKMGGRVFRIDTDRLVSHFQLTASPSHDKPSFRCNTPVGTFTSDEITAVWIRRPFGNSDLPRTAHEKLTHQESYSTINALTDFFTPQKTLIVDHPSYVNRASEKITQLLIAKSLGIDIPSSLITPDVKDATRFVQQHNGNVIVKAIKYCYAETVDDGISIPTSLLKKDVNLSMVRNCPTLFQENIEKVQELRITIIGRRLFTVAFNVQHIPEARIDFRDAMLKIMEVPHEVVRLPKKLERQLMNLLAYYHLNFGAIDMAKTSSGDYVFFELNPAGQFLWLDLVTDLKLADEMAKFLLGIH